MWEGVWWDGAYACTVHADGTHEQHNENNTDVYSHQYTHTHTPNSQPPHALLLLLLLLQALYNISGVEPYKDLCNVPRVPSAGVHTQDTPVAQVHNTTLDTTHQAANGGVGASKASSRHWLRLPKV